MDAVVISDVFGTKAGAYMATLLLCRALDELGFNVTCFATWIEPGHPATNERFKVVKPRVTRGYRWDWPNRSLAAQAIRHIRRRPPKLVVVVGITRLSRYLLSSPVANRLMVWELTDACGNKFVDEAASELLPRCKAMLSPSATIDRNIRKHYRFEGVIKRLPFWVEDQNCRFTEQPQKFTADFIYFGRRDEEKGLRELVQATSILAVEFPSLQVVIGGVGDEQSFASLARDLNVEKNVVFSMFASRRDVNDALASSRCLVLPSYHEGYPLVLLEAARSSLPFIATDVGSIREVYGESMACIIVKPRAADDLAQAMRQMLCEPEQSYRKRKTAAYELFKKLSSSDRVAENLNSIVQPG